MRKEERERLKIPDSFSVLISTSTDAFDFVQQLISINRFDFVKMLNYGHDHDMAQSVGKYKEE